MKDFRETLSNAGCGWYSALRDICWSRTMGLVFVFCTIIGCNGTSSNLSLTDPKVLSHDFGAIRQNQTVQHIFRLQNNDAAALKIAKTVSSCRCTVAKGIEGVVVQPAMSLDVPVALNATGKLGQVDTSISLVLEGKEAPKVLQLSATVVREHPDTLDFGDVRRGQKSAQFFSIDTFPGQPALEISRIKNTNEWLSATFEKNTQDSGSVEVAVSIGAEPPFGRFDIPLHIETNDTDAPRKVIHVKGYVLPILEFSEREIYFGELRLDTPETLVEVWSPYEEPVEILSVENSRDTYFTWSLSENENRASSTKITISIKPATTLPQDATPGVVKGELRLHARVGTADLIERIEVYGLVPSRGGARTTASAAS